MNSMRKRLRSTENDGKTMEDNRTDSDGIDRISMLPSEILCHILSFMPTKYAVGTSVLSTKWKNLFPLIPNLKVRLDDSFLIHPETAPSTYLVSFKNFVERLLNVTLRDVPSLQLLCLVCQKFDDGREIAKWIRSALRIKIKRMDIRLRRLRNPNFVLNSLYGCNIFSLNLLLNFAENAPECRFSLPNLKMLSVQYMKFKHANVLLASCPVLEFLALNTCYCQPGEKLRISVPSLRALKLISGVYSFEGEFEIDAPKLEYISYDGFLAGGYSATRMKSLRIARFDHDESFIRYPFESDEKAAQLVRVCADAEKYWMSEIFVAILQNYPHPLPWFRKMISLTIRSMDYNGWKLLRRVLDCAPKLNKLSFKSGFDNESYEKFKASLKEPLSFCMSREGETGVILKIQRNVGKPGSSLPGCSGAGHS